LKNVLHGIFALALYSRIALDKRRMLHYYGYSMTGGKSSWRIATARRRK
jgi:hypothetical protein